VSGRYGSDLQQLPKPKEDGEADPIIVKYNNEIRAFFVTDPGYLLIDNDFESLEPHIFASISNDEALQEIFNQVMTSIQQLLSELKSLTNKETSTLMEYQQIKRLLTFLRSLMHLNEIKQKLIR
jgi:hypothetical protein